MHAVLSGLFASGIVLIAAMATDGPSPRSQWDGIFTEAQALRGSRLYVGNCEPCHGANLLGLPTPTPSLGSQDAPPLIGSEFASHWNDLSMSDLFDRIRISMPQSAPGSLSRQQNADILAFILLRGDYPAGERELPAPDPNRKPPVENTLTSITFLASRP